MSLHHPYNFINEVIKANSYTHYLDLGSGNNKNSKAHGGVSCENKVSVDVEKNSNYKMHFRDFFTLLKTDEKIEKEFDCIYRDSGYTYENVKETMYESHELLVENGVIICNFSDPQSEEFQRPIEFSQEEILESENGKVGYRKKDGWGMDKWIGHAWKVLVEMHYDSSILVDVVIIHGNQDDGGIRHGLGIVRKIPQNNNLVNVKKKLYDRFSTDFLSFKYYKEHQNNIMNVVDKDTFFNDYILYQSHLQSSFKFWNQKGF